MNKRQKYIIRHFLIVLVITVVFITAIYNIRDAVNRSESMREMRTLGNAVTQYRQEHFSLPPESWLKPVKDEFARLNVTYRAQWIPYNAPDDTILAYSKRIHRSLFVESGYVVLLLNGDVRWMGIDEFDKTMARQQSEFETQAYQETLRQTTK